MDVVLGCSLGGAGHLMPIVGAARALARLGHDPVVLVPPALAAATAEANVAFVIGDQPPTAVVDALWERVRAGPADEVVGLIDRELFARHAADAMRDAAQRLCERRMPGVVVRESCEYATAFAAHRLGIPQLQVGISQSRIEHGVLGLVAETLEARAPGVVDAIDAGPYLTAFPASLDPSPWPDTRRYRVRSAPARPLPDWWPGDRRPLIYVTFGSVLGQLAEARDVYDAALRAVDGLPARVLLTVGSAVDLTGLGPLPENVHVEPWVAQTDAFAAADLVVCHGGSGTVFGALAAGVALVVCPLFADQGANAVLVEAAGAGVVVAPRHPSVGGLSGLTLDDAPRMREAIISTLGDAPAGAAARRVGAELACAPLLDDVLAQLEER